MYGGLSVVGEDEGKGFGNNYERELLSQIEILLRASDRK